MKIFAAIIFLSLFSPALASGDFTRDDCTLDPDAVVTPINNKSNNIKIIKAPFWDSLRLINTVEFKDGSQLTFSQENCIHSTYTYRFYNIKNFPQKLDAQTIALIKSYMAKIPLNNIEVDNRNPSKLANFIFSEKSLSAVKKSGDPLTNFGLSYTDYTYIYFRIYEDGFSIGFDYAA